jgi:aryl-alcohol dehydrogenase-like predicted oxidoreductase
LLSGAVPAERGDTRSNFPRFAGENFVHNQNLVRMLAGFAAKRGVRPAQIAIAWVIARKPDAIPVVGARTRKQIEEAVGALRVELSPSDLLELESAIQATGVAGKRYSEFQWKHLNSEL